MTNFVKLWTKRFYNIGPWAYNIKLYGHNCCCIVMSYNVFQFHLLPSLYICRQGWSLPKCSPLRDSTSNARFLVLPASIRLRWKCLTVSNPLAYGNNYCRKKFYWVSWSDCYFNSLLRLIFVGKGPSVGLEWRPVVDSTLVGSSLVRKY